MQTSSQTTQSERVITLRPVTATDEAFVRDLYASTRSEEMALVPWTNEQRDAFIDMQFRAQLDHYAQYSPQATHEIILENGNPVGRLYIERVEGEIKILDITIAPKDRNTGIGGRLMNSILDEAGQLRKRVGIYVESFNPSLQFFKRLGFVETEQSGIHVHLQWFPAEGDTNESPAVLGSEV